MTELWLATTNTGKVREIRALLNSLSSESIHDVSELGYYSAPPETGATFEENALIKARSLAKLKPNCWVLADDSGLCVDGLDGLPGIHSARYAGPKARDFENVAKLMKMMNFKTPTHRAASFHCAMVLIHPDGQESLFKGLLKGTISKKVQGTQGFGYDPVFIPEGHNKTMAELLPKDKNKISHRYQCLKQLKSLFSDQA